ncbi:MAG: glycosyltransferase [Oscillospiraceae bacterium]|nr:glycosyltransferase [Oscillospiraceae bacterium]
MTEQPGISIVIASKGRVKLLGELLESIQIARNTYDGSSEVLVIDDSKPQDAERIRAHCEKYDTHTINFGPSVSGKRNLGAREAQYELLLFLDSDCIATSQLLNEHVKPYANSEVGGVAGPLEFVGTDTWFWKAVEKSPFVTSFGLPALLDEVPWAPTANFSIRKGLFTELGGFDESFPNKPGGEDVDLCLRMTKQGWCIACSKEGLVYHSKSTWIPVKDMFRRLWHYGNADCYLTERHADNSMATVPRRLLIYVAMLILLSVCAIFSSWWLLVAFPLWLLLDISLTSILINKFATNKRTNFAQQVAVQLMMLTNEAGYLYRCLRKKKPQFWFLQLVHFDGQMEDIQRNSTINMWSLLIVILLILATTVLIII